jgi:site-specific recombinase XerD
MKSKPIVLLRALSEFFDSYLPETKGLSRNTVKSYQYAFQLLYEFLFDVKGIPPEKAAFEDLSEDTVIEFLSWLETSRGCSVSTRNQRLAAICSFAKFAMRKSFDGAIAFGSEVLDIPKKKKPKDNDIKYFTLEELSIMLSLPDTSTKIGCRDAVLMSTLYASGARAQEICDLTVNDIFFGTATKVQLVGKGSKGRTVVVPENCAKLLKSYIDYKIGPIIEDTRARHVFSSQTNEKMSISCVEEIVKKYVRKAKQDYPSLFCRKNYTPHSFRHSIAVHMLEAGESIAVIRAFLGHSSISSTLVYASVTPELANKYLRERGKPLETVTLASKQDSIIAALPFLKNVHLRSKVYGRK